MFDVGGGELMLIILAVLLLFGPKKIPEVAQMLGKGMRKFREAQDEFTQHIRDISTQVETEVNSVSQEVSSVTTSTTQTISAIEEQFNSNIPPQLPEQHTESALDYSTTTDSMDGIVADDTSTISEVSPQQVIPRSAEGNVSR